MHAPAVLLEILRHDILDVDLVHEAIEEVVERTVSALVTGQALSGPLGDCDGGGHNCNNCNN